jgi:hypothetical protein
MSETLKPKTKKYHSLADVHKPDFDPMNVDPEELLEVIREAAKKSSKGPAKWLRERGLSYESR